MRFVGNMLSAKVGFGELPAIVDIAAPLSFHVPHDIIAAHRPPKSGAPFGMVVVFAMACAGHVEYVRRGGDTLPPRPPLGCFDERGAELSPDDSVFAYAQVFSFAGRSNANPVLDHLTSAGAPVTRPKGSRSTIAPRASESVRPWISTPWSRPRARSPIRRTWTRAVWR